MNIHQRMRARSTKSGSLVFLSQTPRENLKKGGGKSQRGARRRKMWSGLSPRGCWYPERQDDGRLPRREIIKVHISETFCPFKEFSTSLGKSNLQNFYLEKWLVYLISNISLPQRKTSLTIFLAEYPPTLYIHCECLPSILHYYESSLRERNPYPVSNKYKRWGGQEEVK